MRIRSFIASFVAVALVAMSAGPAFAIHRTVVTSRGRAWLYDHVPYSQSKYHEGYRTDCSGFTSMCWELRNSAGSPKSLSTRTLYQVSRVIPMAGVQPGDALCYPGHHVFIFLAWTDLAHTGMVTLEESGSKTGTVSRVRTTAALDSGYRAYRYLGIEQDPPWTSRLQFIEGPDRYATAVKASAASFTSASTVVIAAGDGWADALGASALAGSVGGPILLVKRGSVPPVTRNEITRLKATRAIIVGGTGVVSDQVIYRLREQGLAVERLAGVRRTVTASAVAGRTIKALTAADRSYERTVFLAGGESWYNALAAGAPAAKKGWPILLAEGGKLSREASRSISDLKVKRLIAIGMSDSVTDDTLRAIKARGISTERWTGTDRYTTALKVAEKCTTSLGMSWWSVAVGSGTSYVDLVAAGPAQAKANSFVVLSPPRTLHASVKTQIANHRFKSPRVRTLGGDAAINFVVRHSLYDAAAAP